MDQRMGWLAVGLGLGVGVVACSSNVLITAESTTGSSSSAHGSSSGHPGGTGGAGSGSGSSGTGAAGPGSGKVVTADSDIGQYASFTIMASNPGAEQKVVDGPFFVTDVHGDGCSLDTVLGSDCSVPQNQHTSVMSLGYSQYSLGELHGMKLPVLASQTLCVVDTASSLPCTVLGFRPY